MKKIVVLNPKGGSGKTTVATNIAAYYAAAGHKTALMDFDSQGSSSRWIAGRGPDLPPIELIKAFERKSRVTRAWQLHASAGVTHLIVDTAAGSQRDAIQDLVHDSHAVIIPVLPSEIDIHAASRCIGDLLMCAKIRPRDGRIGVIANRTKKNTRVYHDLLRFLKTLEIPFITSLRDAQAYVYAAGLGQGIFELPRYKVRADIASWSPLLAWLRAREADVINAPPLAASIPLAAVS